jgi:hypothetical protein
MASEKTPSACPTLGRVARMKLEEVQRILDAEPLSPCDLGGIEVEMGCGADLMSDVLAFVKRGALLLTGLTNTQVVRTAEMAEVVAVCFVRGKRPPQETSSLAASTGLPLLVTGLPMFEACGRLYENGLKGCSQCDG